MTILKSLLEQKISEHRPRTARLLGEWSEVVVDAVTIGQIVGGARDIHALVTDISYLDPQEGIRFRGKNIPETFAALPKAAGCEYPSVEAFWFFLLTGEVPSLAQAREVQDDLSRRAAVPRYVFEVLRAQPEDTHPMTLLSMAVLCMQRESAFAARHREVRKTQYWELMYEDCCDLLARLPEIAAFIYRLKYRQGDIIGARSDLDFGANFAHMMGIPRPYDDVARMYFILHSDHESGNVSAHATHLVASALSDAYYSFSAGLNGLAGPLHGLANQEVLSWILHFQQTLGDTLPDEDRVREALWETLSAGQVIPGYGHAVLRRTDPRYTAQMEFCQRHMPDDPLFRLVNMIYRVAPRVLSEHGKTKNPWPNVDSHSGVVQWHYGLREHDFYTVLFGVGRAIGVLANIIWDRALAYPIERPKSVTTDMLEAWGRAGGRNH
ncbi:MAG: citrate (Si)-synthase [Roseateles asaccharophilus]|uniref:citrate synthase (unknown stereospecificity) n=1 Tax=Roseateles asaccharophilus TaxID=582607 RepID=A0A4R6MVC4_9BURK|nr:citrate (Si)-synthase [Roseateles asaccharophilus]MDN3544308.1 citrate (Si)-synthase [Roseateles asaccharophilus]TDP06389.1 citrate synthase [Roseateles asaccharophilus]